jgi:hypothetical protein
LFLDFINDLDGAALLIDILRKFSDDTKLGQTVGTLEERYRLQMALDNLLDGHRGGAWNSISKSVKLCTWVSTIQATPTLWGIIS